MAESGNDSNAASSSNPSNYTSFDQFIAQNNFSHLNNGSFRHNNQYYSNGYQQYYPQQGENYNSNSYVFPKSTIENSNLTPSATEFVPREISSQVYYNSNENHSNSEGRFNGNYQSSRQFNGQYNGNSENHGYPSNSYSENNPNVEIPLGNLNLNGNNTHSQSGRRKPTGAIPKQPKPRQNYRENGIRTNRDFDGFRGRNEGKYRSNSNSNPNYERQHRNRRADYDENRDYYVENSKQKNPPRFNKNHNKPHNNDNKPLKETETHNSNNSDPPIKRNNNKKSNNHPDFKPNRNLKKHEPFVMPIDISQREKLVVEIDSGKLECLVCCENIKPFQSTWCCKNCYHILHLNCTIKWAQSSKSEDGWRCPACQNVSEDVPRDYFCFCGKLKNPQYNRNDVAHSCGELCGRFNGCDHPCTLLCHPGACPTCQATVTRKCGCGSTSKMMQCNQNDEIICDGVCEKLRSCGEHKCSEKCHPDECKDCPETVEHNCYCGKNKKEVECTKENLSNLNYGCAKNCNKRLNCGNHKCQKTCHAGECGDCRLAPDLIKSCPCGKRNILLSERKSCLDAIPLCGNVCGKPLKCGSPSNPHLCISKCHTGSCPPCNKSTAVKCRCGHMDQMIKCRQLTSRADDARCKKKCTKKRNCGKHRCNLECCIDIDHICPLPCPSTLSCGKHKCDKTCHPGHCLPCLRSSFQELQCECGAQVIYPPIPCGTKKPSCDKPCQRQHVCDHEVLHNCHTAPTCPPCMIQTTKWCFGKHEQRKTIVCSDESFSCGMPCNKELSCKRHKCIKTCHTGPCESETDVCKQSCPKTRVACSHKCNAPCHDGDCPDTLCKEAVEVMCQCGHRKQTRSCHDFANEFRRIATAALANSLQEMQSGNSVEFREIFGPIKMANNKTLECNDECQLIERNRRLAIGLQIRNPDLQSKFQPKYSEFLKGWAKKDSVFVAGIHDKLTELVKLAKESKQRFRSHSFPTMNRDKRHVVHEMCEMFGVESVAYDAEPNRNIVATAHKEKSWLPSMSLMEVIKRESGQRRVPLPTANAWNIKRDN